MYLKANVCATMVIVVAIVVSVLTIAALDKHEKSGKFGFTALGITEVSKCVCVLHLCM